MERLSEPIGVFPVVAPPFPTGLVLEVETAPFDGDEIFVGFIGLGEDVHVEIFG